MLKQHGDRMVPRVREVLGSAEIEHNPRNKRMRAT